MVERAAASLGQRSDPRARHHDTALHAQGDRGAQPEGQCGHHHRQRRVRREQVRGGPPRRRGGAARERGQGRLALLPRRRPQRRRQALARRVQDRRGGEGGAEGGDLPGRERRRRGGRTDAAGLGGSVVPAVRLRGHRHPRLRLLVIKLVSPKNSGVVWARCRCSVKYSVR